MDSDMSAGGPGMEIPEKFICTGRKGPDRDVDGVMGQDDDLELEIVALKLFRMIVLVGDVQDERLTGGNGQAVRGEDVFFQMEGIGACRRCPGARREKESGREKKAGQACRFDRPGKTVETAWHQRRPGCPVDRAAFSGSAPPDVAFRVWERRQRPANMTAR